MEKSIVNKYLDLIKNKDGYEAFEAYLFFNIAPVLERVKPASLVRITERKGFLGFWNSIKESLNIQGIKHCEIKTHCGSVVVLFYNDAYLLRHLNREENKEYLRSLGYNSFFSSEGMIDKLKTHFMDSCPHEIGIFLGYPLKDTLEFIKQSGKNCLLCGYWKVYNNIERAQYIFSCYDKAKYNILNQVFNQTIRLKYSF